VQHRWIEIRTVGPNQGVGLWIQLNSIENGWVLEGTEKLSPEHRSKVDDLKRAVLELQTQGKGRHLLESDDAVDLVCHVHGYFNASILDGDRLVIGVEVREVMLATSFHEHPNHDAEESGNLRHVLQPISIPSVLLRLDDKVHGERL